MIYAITYDLNKNGQNYPSLYESIKSLGATIHPMQNLWFVDTIKSVLQARMVVQDAIDTNDNVFVVRVFRDEWDCYMSKSAIDWLNARL